jgi:hypothetical protein
VDEDLWLKLDNGLLTWEVFSVALFHLGGQLLCPSPVLSPPKEKQCSTKTGGRGDEGAGRCTRGT